MDVFRTALIRALVTAAILTAITFAVLWGSGSVGSTGPGYELLGN